MGLIRPDKGVMLRCDAHHADGNAVPCGCCLDLVCVMRMWVSPSGCHHAVCSTRCWETHDCRVEAAVCGKALGTAAAFSSFQKVCLLETPSTCMTHNTTGVSAHPPCCLLPSSCPVSLALAQQLNLQTKQHTHSRTGCNGAPVAETSLPACAPATDCCLSAMCDVSGAATCPHLKLQGGSWWDDTTRPPLPVGQLSGNHQQPASRQQQCAQTQPSHLTHRVCSCTTPSASMQRDRSPRPPLATSDRQTDGQADNQAAAHTWSLCRQQGLVRARRRPETHLLPPSFIAGTPSVPRMPMSQPRMTSPTPILKVRGRPRS